MVTLRTLRRPVLIVDDEPNILIGFSTQLKLAGLTDVLTCDDSDRVMELLTDHDVELILLDLMMPGLSGQELLRRISEKHPGIPVVIVTGFSDVETAVECMQVGAYDYLVKPVEPDRLVTSILKAAEFRALQSEIGEIRESLLAPRPKHPEAFAPIVTQNQRMKKLFLYAEAIAALDSPILITGETGVGKDLLAQALHDASGRTGPFVRVNTAGLDDQSFSDTLFGHKRGAFTGADRDRAGQVQQAAGGTLFLDEIGDISSASQLKLLDLIQNRQYCALGADEPKPTDARIISATNRDLRALQGGGDFRQDLYFRLMTHTLEIPALRERLDDLPALLIHFFERAAHAQGKKVPTWPSELIQLLAAYHFPGNVRELHAMVVDALSRHRGRVLSLATFREHIERQMAQDIGEQSAFRGATSDLFSRMNPLPTIKLVNQLLIDEALKRTGGNLSVAAKLVGMSRQGLAKHLKKLED